MAATEDEDLSRHIRERYARVLDLMFDYAEAAFRGTAKLSEREMVLKVMMPPALRDAQAQHGSAADAERREVGQRILQAVRDA